MTQEQWSAVDRYLTDALLPPDDALEHAQRTSAAAGMRAIAVAPNQGKLLALLARSIGSRRILEIGTLGGYSTIWLARELPEGGRLVTLEISPQHAEIARENLTYAGLGDRVEVRVGAAVDTLKALAAEGVPRFDFVFIDADKAHIPEYFTLSLALTRPGGMIIVDNVVRGGAVADSGSADPDVQGVRRFNELAARESRVRTTAVQTVGSKGYDGFALVLVAT
jgi:predicted O-methyltransferase YrrM